MRPPARYPAATMRVLILGGDGYLGWPTAMRFSARGHEVSVVDSSRAAAGTSATGPIP